MLLSFLALPIAIGSGFNLRKSVGKMGSIGIINVNLNTEFFLVNCFAPEEKAYHYNALNYFHSLLPGVSASINLTIPFPSTAA